MARCPTCGRPGYCPTCGRSGPVRSVPPGRHHSSCNCRGCRNGIARHESGLIAFDMIAIAVVAAIAGIIWVAMEPLRIWHKIGADGQEHPVTATYIAYGAGAAVIMGALMFASLRAPKGPDVGPKRPRPPRGRLRVEATVPPAMPPAPPPCLHLRAVKVDSVLNRQVIHCCWCPDCETELPANFRWSCCGAEPGTLPGAPHAYNCPSGFPEVTL